MGPWRSPHILLSVVDQDALATACGPLEHLPEQANDLRHALPLGLGVSGVPVRETTKPLLERFFLHLEARVDGRGEASSTLPKVLDLRREHRDLRRVDAVHALVAPGGQHHPLRAQQLRDTIEIDRARLPKAKYVAQRILRDLFLRQVDPPKGLSIRSCSASSAMHRKALSSTPS